MPLTDDECKYVADAIDGLTDDEFREIAHPFYCATVGTFGAIEGKRWRRCERQCPSCATYEAQREQGMAGPPLFERLPGYELDATEKARAVWS